MFTEESIKTGDLDHLFQKLMKASMLLSFFVTVTASLFGLNGLIKSPLFLIEALFPIPAIIFSWYCLTLSQKGKTEAALKIYLAVILSSLIIATIVFDGIYSPALVFFIWPISISGMLIRPKWSLYMSIGVIIFYVVLVLLTNMDLYSPILNHSQEVQLLLSKVYLIFIIFLSVGVVSYLGMERSKEITQKLKDSELELFYMANHDALTGLNNRAAFFSDFKKAIARGRRSNKPLALLFIDLDGFKSVNDKLGHQNGDILLKEVASRLTKSTREMDILARIGGDEFICVFEAEKNVKTFAQKKAEQIIASLSAPFEGTGHKINIGASIGISLFPHDSNNIESLINYADVAMYKAKQNGHNQFYFWTEEESEPPSIPVTSGYSVA